MIVLDTHAWLWWLASPRKLGRGARAAIDSAQRIGVASISCWELAMLVRKERIRLDREIGTWIAQALAHERVEPLPLVPRIAIAAALLDGDGAPADAADRIIYATAREHELLVTRDRALRDFDPPLTVW